jgi:hypothetical protein
VQLQMILELDAPANQGVFSCYCWVTVVAAIGGAVPAGVTLQNYSKVPVSGYQGGTQPQPLATVVTPPLISIAAIAGFSITLLNPADPIIGVGASAGFTTTSLGTATTMTPMASATLVANGTGGNPMIEAASVDIGVLVMTQSYGDLGFSFCFSDPGPGLATGVRAYPWTYNSSGTYPTDLQVNSLMQSFYAGWSQIQTSYGAGYRPPYFACAVLGSAALDDSYAAWAAIANTGSGVVWSVGDSFQAWQGPYVAGSFVYPAEYGAWQAWNIASAAPGANDGASGPDT